MTLKNKLIPFITAGVVFFPDVYISANTQNKSPALEQVTQENSILQKTDLGTYLIQNAKEYLGREYRWNGRDTKKNPDIDCMGLVFLAYSKTTGKPWYNLSVNPSELVKSGKLGRPVNGLEGVLREDIDYSKLKEGDVVYFLVQNFAINDAPLAEIDGNSYWPWHMGLYEGGTDHLILHASPMEEVKSQPIEEIGFDALLVTRLK